MPRTKSLKLLAPSRALLSQGLFHLGVFLEGTVGEGLRGATPRPQGLNSGAVTVLALGSGAGSGPAVEIRVFPYRCHWAAVGLAHLACWPPSPSGRVRPALVLGPLLGRPLLVAGCFVDRRKTCFGFSLSPEQQKKCTFCPFAFKSFQKSK